MVAFMWNLAPVICVYIYHYYSSIIIKMMGEKMSYPNSCGGKVLFKNEWLFI